MEEVKICISERLQAALDKNHITNYGPAYNGESVGLDLYYTGEKPIYWDTDSQDGRLHGSFDQVKLLSTGLQVWIPQGYVGLIVDRGSIVKCPLERRAGVIDPGFSGEVFVNLIRPNPTVSYAIHPGEKLPVQLIVVASLSRFVPITSTEYQLLIGSSKRQANQVGSSDVK